MNSFVKKFVENLSFTFIANLLSLIISTVLILIVPKIVSVSDYGYWQLYIFYCSFISYMSFGLTDGAYLRYGGYHYKDLYKPVFVTQYWFLVLLNVVINFSLATSYALVSTDPNKSIVVFLTCLSGILVVPRSLIVFMLQSTNRIKGYSITIILERIIYFILVVLFLLFGIQEFEFLIISDVIGKLCSGIYACLICKELVFGKFESIKKVINEIRVNISVGSKLLVANFASLLIIGIVRFFIETQWSIKIFGKVSLTLSISNMFLLFINSIGLILFPTLRRTSKDKLPVIYGTMRTMIMVPLLGLLILYFPTNVILSSWLPQYAESFIYMILLFPMCIFESKTQMLTNTYLKTLRKEKIMLLSNLLTVGLSLVLTFTNVFVLKSLNLTLLSITILLAFRSIIAELYIGKYINIKVKIDIILELFMTMAFILLSWYLSSIVAFFIYIIAYLFYLLVKKKDIVFVVKSIRNVLNS